MVARLAKARLAMRAPKEKSTARMDDTNRAICYVHRHPGPGIKKTPYKILATLLKKSDGQAPSQGSMSEAAARYTSTKEQRGRKKGWQKTTKKENRAIIKKFHTLRPPGCGIDSRDLHKGLKKKLRQKISRRTVINRLADKGYTAQVKLTKHDPSKALCLRRVKFAKPYKFWTKAMWKAAVQAVGDIKIFTYYPEKIYAKFKRLRSTWTYMNEKERHQAAFQRPKRWFPKSEWKLTKPQKIFGMTTSNGQMLAFLIPSPFDASVWAKLVRTKVAPFLRRSFPSRASFKILLDSEQIFHAPIAKEAYRECNIEILAGWPKYSPELNPQENVWPLAETALRKKEGDGGETFEEFQQLALAAVREYVGAKNLVGGMVSRIKECLDSNGAYMSQ